jgi:phosphatidylethanolamine/phosphatidyl-N-methylethanolamine N-methyltransferase
MRDSLRFVSAFLRHPASVGAIAPSSQHLARLMVRDLAVEPGEAIVEFGPGTGPFTQALGDLLPDRSAYLGIERDPQFVALLRQRFADMRVVEGSAADAVQHVRDCGFQRVRAIVCGLPFASLPPSVQDSVIQAIDILLTPGSEFRTFQYVHAFPLPTAIRYRRRMRAVFGPPTITGPVLRNLPPACVLTWKR